MAGGLVELRILGAVSAVILLIFALHQLQSYRPGRGATFLALIGGLLLALVSIFPGVANLPTELLSLDALPAGRVITLLLLSNLLLWFAVLWNRYKISYAALRNDRLVRSLAVGQFFREYGDTIPDASEAIWVVVPAYDEEPNLPEVLPKIASEVHGRPVRVIVVNDGSVDRTSSVSRELGAYVVDMPVNVGGGAAHRAGFDTALAIGARYVVTLDADGQNQPSDMADVVEPILKDEADVVIGSRLLGEFEQTNVARTVGVPVFNLLISVLIGKKVTDCASNYRAFSAKVLREVVLIQEQYHTAEMLIEAAKRGFRIIERPINWKRRIHGETKKAASVFYGAFFLRTILKTWLR